MADHTHVTEVRPVYIVVSGFDRRLVDHGHDGYGEVNLEPINDGHAKTAKYRKYDTPFYKAGYFTWKEVNNCPKQMLKSFKKIGHFKINQGSQIQNKRLCGS